MFLPLALRYWVGTGSGRALDPTCYLAHSTAARKCMKESGRLFWDNAVGMTERPSMNCQRTREPKNSPAGGARFSITKSRLD